MKKIENLITSDLINDLFNIKIDIPSFNGIGDVYSNHREFLLSYIKNDSYINVLNNNKNIHGVICKSESAIKIDPRITKIIHEDPNFAFFSLVDYFGKKIGHKNKSVIESDILYNNIYISDCDVNIGKNVIIEPNVTIHPGVIIKDNVIIRSGSVIGLDSFQHQRTIHGIFSPKHDGFLLIENNVEIGANSTLSRGFSYRNTIIGANSKLDAQVYIAHGVNIGSDNIICAGAKVMGHVKIGNNTFIGPASVISSRLMVEDKSRISLGSIVTKNVIYGQTVTGNFAIPHDIFIENLKNIIN